MKAELIAVGTELLLGNIVNTNAQYLSRQLSDMGIDVYFQTTVGDNEQRLLDCLSLSLSRADLVILTGGLGPTMDDLTKETVARHFGLEMKLHQPSYDHINNFFIRQGRQMTQNNKKQAFFPEGSIVMSNSRGTAPGCIVERGGKSVVILPGPPYEMQAMFEKHVRGYLRSKSADAMTTHMLRVFGIGESALEDQIRDLLLSQSNPTIALYAGFGEVKIRITVKCGRDEDPMAYIAPLEDELRSRLGDAIYAIGDKELHQVVAEMLMESGRTIALAESCTGGLIASSLVDTPGISGSLMEAHVTYSNASKVRTLGVSEETLDKYGAVSEQTAVEMARGLLERSGADITLSVTGVAGPGGGTEEKPVGLVYLALCRKDGDTLTKCIRQVGTRTRVRNMAKLHALDMIRRALL
ncbi:MAG: competence/damage-inducible protein A [Christensenellales bacterium]|jgi:nicotinamide-nucleotide amidase